MTQLAASKRKRLRRRSVLTAAAVTGVAASFLALTFLRIGPAEQADAQLTGSSTSVVAAAPAERAELKGTEALAGKADVKAVAPEKSGTSTVAKPDVAGPAAAKSDQSTAVAPPEEKAAAKPAPAKVAAKPGAQQAEADSCAALSESVDVFLQHFYAAHLERSPEGQVTDILDLDQYVLTHTVMIEDMLKPQLSLDTTKSVDVFLQHLYAAHLERSLEGQVTDALDLDQYVLTHTVMIEDMLKPIAGGELGAC
jgi:hypothetical protein